MKKDASRILIYCQDSFGLGHLRRTVNIAHDISRQSPDTTIIFVADSPLAPFFKLPPNSDFIKLPTIVKVNSGVWEAPRLTLSLKNLRKIRSRIIRKVAKHYQPDVMLVDHMPHGAMGELIPTLKMLRRRLPETQIVLGLRDILGASESIIRLWHEEGAYEAIEKYYDAVLVYGNQEVYDLGLEYEFSEQMRRKVHYTGYVFAPGKQNYGQTSELSAQFAIKRPHTVLVTGGGGSDAHFFMDKMLDAVRKLGSSVPFNTYMVTGPFMPQQDRQHLTHKAEGLPVIVKRKESDCRKLFPQVDLVASMAGYNTICEILGFGKRAVVIPRSGPSAEQSMRSRLLHDQGYIYTIHPHDLTPTYLADTLLNRLNGNGRSHIVPEGALDLDGANHAATYLLEEIWRIPAF